MNPLQDRQAYADRMEELAGSCAFCLDRDDIAILDKGAWTWTYARYPYVKYHSLLIPKRHVLDMSELNAKELQEFAEFSAYIKQAYLAANLIGEDSPGKKQLLSFWRNRPWIPKQKNPVRHLHIHYMPEGLESMRVLMEHDAHEFDLELLRSAAAQSTARYTETYG